MAGERQMVLEKLDVQIQKKTKNKVYTLNKTLRWSKDCNVKCDAMYNHQEITGEESN